MARARESSTDKDLNDVSDFSDVDSIRKPSWIHLAPLDGAGNDSLMSRLLYKPALRFHGFTGSWGSNLSGPPSVLSESRPPSYRFSESLASKVPGDMSNMFDNRSVHNVHRGSTGAAAAASAAAMSSLTLRKRNTVAVVMVAIALLAAIAAIIGIVLQFLGPKDMLRANVRFTIANRNYTDQMVNKSSEDFLQISTPLCLEMDVYFLTSELADFYLGCNVVSLSEDAEKPGLAAHYTLDFQDNKLTHDGDRIKNIIMKKSGRHKTDDTLYLMIRQFLVYLRSLRVDLEVVPFSDKHPPRSRIPWRDDLDFIPRKSDDVNNITESILVNINQLTTTTTTALNIGDGNVSELNSPGKQQYMFSVPPQTLVYTGATLSPSVSALFVPMSVSMFNVVQDNVPFVVSVSQSVPTYKAITGGAGSIAPTTNGIALTRASKSISPTNDGIAPTKASDSRIPTINGIAPIRASNSISPTNDGIAPTLAFDSISPTIDGIALTKASTEASDSSTYTIANIAPTKAFNFLYEPIQTHSMFPDLVLPVAREFENIGNIIKSEKISRKRILAKGQHISSKSLYTDLPRAVASIPKNAKEEINNLNNGKHRPKLEILQSSYMEQNQKLHKNILETAALDKTTGQTLTSDVMSDSNGKVVTIFSDVFLISGRNDFTPQPTPSIITTHSMTSIDYTATTLTFSPISTVISSSVHSSEIYSSKSSDAITITSTLTTVDAYSRLSSSIELPVAGMKEFFMTEANLKKVQIASTPATTVFITQTDEEITDPFILPTQVHTSEVSMGMVTNQRHNSVQTYITPTNILQRSTTTYITVTSKDISRPTIWTNSNLNVPSEGGKDTTSKYNTIVVKGIDSQRDMKSYPVIHVELNNATQNQPIDVNTGKSDNVYLPSGIVKETVSIVKYQPVVEGNDTTNLLTHVVLGNEFNGGMEMQELLLEPPIQENVLPNNEDIHWNNIFNIPRDTIRVKVGEVLNNMPSGITSNENPLLKTTQFRSKAKIPVQQTDTEVSKPASEVDKQIIDLIPDAWSLLSNTDSLTAGIGAINTSVNTLIPPSIFVDSNGNHPIRIRSKQGRIRHPGGKENILPHRDNLISVVRRPIVKQPAISRIQNSVSNDHLTGVNQIPRPTILLPRNTFKGNTIQNRIPIQPHAMAQPRSFSGTSTKANIGMPQNGFVNNLNTAAAIVGVHSIASLNSQLGLMAGFPSSSGTNVVTLGRHGPIRRDSFVSANPRMPAPQVLASDGIFKTQNKILGTNHVILTNSRPKRINTELDPIGQPVHSSHQLQEIDPRNTLVVGNNLGTGMAPNEQLNTFYTRRGIYNGRNAIMISKSKHYPKANTVSTSQFNPSIREFQYPKSPKYWMTNENNMNNKRRYPKGAQPWSLLETIGLNENVPDTTIFNPRPSPALNDKYYRKQYGNRRRKVSIYDRRPAPRLQVHNIINKQKYFFKKYMPPLPDYRRPVYSPFVPARFLGRSKYSGRRFASTGARYRPARNYPLSFGRPKSGDFADIEDMKNILNDLIASVYNMTSKLDTMDNAIQFANKTYHDTHQPLLNFEDTIRNMTQSLDNFSHNMNDVNKILKDFKDYIGQFDDTIFNFDDILQNLDDTVKHLNSTVNSIGNSIVHLNDSVNAVADNAVDVDASLKHIDNSVLGVHTTTMLTNITLDSMISTLESLEDAVRRVKVKMNHVNKGLGGIDVSLSNINNTVHNSYNKLGDLHDRLSALNNSAKNVAMTVDRLNGTYIDINKRLETMNETFTFANGTALDVIQKLSGIDETLVNVTANMNDMDEGMDSMNQTLRDTMQWMATVMKTVNFYNLSVTQNDKTMILSLKNADLVETVGVLLEINGTLLGLGRNVNGINIKLDGMETQIDALEASLQSLENMLSSINSTFISLNETLQTVNFTMTNMKESLGIAFDKLHMVNGTLIDLDASFTNIHKTLDIVNDSFSIINGTTAEINITTTKLNHTLITLNGTVHKLQDSVQRLNTSINDIEGPLPRMKSLLYNANESLRMLTGKSNILQGSYNVVSKTINGLNATLENLLTKLEETSMSLAQTGDSFNFVDESIRQTEEIYQDMQHQLDDLQRSLEDIKSNMNGMGSTLPNIMKSVLETQDMINDITTRMSFVKQSLDSNTIKRNVTGLRRLNLMQFSNVLNETLLHLRNSLDVVQNLSSSLLNEMQDLQLRLNSTSTNMKNKTANFKYMNETFVPIKNTYKELKTKSMHTNHSLNVILNDLDNVHQKVTEILPKVDKYTNLELFGDDLLEAVKIQKDSIDSAKIHFLNSSTLFVAADEILWDYLGNPTGLHDPIEELQGKTNHINYTVNKHSKRVNQTTGTISNVSEFINGMNDFFSDLDMIIKYLDNINVTENSVNNLAIVFNNMYNDKLKHISKLEEQVRELADVLQIMNSTYGTINGTYDAVDQYSNIMRMMKHTSEKLEKVKDVLTTNFDIFHKSMLKYNESMANLHDKTITVSDQSQIVLNDTLNTMLKTENILHRLTDDIKTIDSDINISNKSLDEAVDEIEVLETDLKYHKRKFDFIQSNHPLVNDTLTSVTRSHNVSYTSLEKAHNYVERLLELAQAVDLRVDDSFLNVNISTAPERIQLNEIQEHLFTLQSQLTNRLELIQGAHDTFTAYNESASPLNDIKLMYHRYIKQLQMLETENLELGTIVSAIFGELDHISEQIANVSKQLDRFEETKQKVDELNVININLNRTIYNTSQNLNTALKSLARVEQTLSKLMQNYTNFTATNVNISESYAHEALLETGHLLEEIALTFNEIELDGQDISITLQMINSTIKTSVFTRRNITSSLDNSIIPAIETLEQNIPILFKNITQLNAKIVIVDLSLIGLNETLNMTNSTLFIDRQKQLLADTKFPGLEEDKNRLNESLLLIDLQIEDAQAQLDDILKMYKSFKERANTHPSFNVSLESYKTDILRLNRTLNEAVQQLFKDRELIKGVANTMFVANGERYHMNESLSDMKERYKKARDILDRIDKDVTNLESTITETKHDERNIDQDLHRWNGSLNRLVDAEKSIENMFEQLNSIKESYGITNTTMHDIEKHLNSTDHVFDNLKNIFANISSVVFYNYTIPIDNQLTETVERFRSVANDMNDLFRVLQNTSTDLKNANESVHDAINNHEDINRVSEIAENSYSNILSNLKNISKYLSILNRESANIDSKLNDVDTQLNETRRIFERQEKEEYYNRNFPKQKYENLGNSFRETNMLLEREYDILNGIGPRLDYLLEKMQDLNSIDISLKDIEDNNNKINNTLNNAKLTLSNISEAFDKANHLKYAQDGNPVSNIETIQEMKTRYSKLNSLADYINTSLNNINQDLKDSDQFLIQQNNSINDINDLMDVFNSTVQLTEELKSSLSDLNKSLEQDHNLLKQHIDSNNNIHDKIRNLSSKYAHVQNKEIAKLWNNVDVLLSNLNESIDHLEGNNSFATKEMTQGYDVLNSYHEKLKQTLTSTKDISDLVSEYVTIDTFLSNVVTQTNETLNDNKRNINFTNELENQLQSNIPQLESMLKLQEKYDYIQHTVPVLNDTFHYLSSETEILEQTLTKLQNKSEHTAGTLNIVDNILKRESTIDISLPKDVINNTFLNLVKTDFSQMQNKLFNLNDAVLNDKDHFFKANNTLSMIKEVLNDFNDTLNEVINEANITQMKLQNIRHILGTEQEYLNELLANIDKLRLLRIDSTGTIDKTDKLIERYAKILNDIQEMGTNISKIDKDMDILSTLYGDVNSTILKQKSNSIQRDILDIKEKHKAIIEDFSNTEPSRTELDRDKTALENILNKTSTSLEALESRTLNASSIMDKMEGNIPPLNESATLLENMSSLLGNDIHLVKESIKTLAGEYKRQQIADYIKRHFPDILNVYHTVNETLTSSTKLINKAKQLLEKFENNLKEADQRVNNLKTIKIPLDNIWKFSNHTGDKIKDFALISSHLQNQFVELQHVMSQNINENDTLDDVKQLFQSYDATLQRLSDDINALNNDTNQTIDDTNQHDDYISELRSQIRRFKTMEIELNNVVKTVEMTGTDIDSAASDIFHTNKSFNALRDLIENVTDTYHDINDTGLHRASDKIENNIDSELKKLQNVGNMFNAISNQFDNSEQNLKNVSRVLQGAIYDLNSLKDVVNWAENVSTAVSKNIVALHHTLDKTVISEVAAQNKTIARYYDHIAELIKRFKEKDKMDLVDEILPGLLKHYANVNSSFANVEENIKQVNNKFNLLNETFEAINKKLSKVPTLNISMNHMRKVINKIHIKHLANNASYGHQTLLFDDLDIEIFPMVDWTNHSIKDVNETFKDAKDNLNNIEIELHQVDSTSNILQQSIRSNIDDIKKIDDLLNTFHNMSRREIEVKNNMTQIQEKIAKTNKLLMNVTDTRIDQHNRISHLNSRYPGITNDEISRLFKAAHDILDSVVDLRLPLVKQLFNNRVKDRFNDTAKTFEKLQLLLNSTFTTKEGFAVALNEVSNHFTNVTDELNTIFNQNSNYNNDGLQLQNILNKSSSILDQLENQLKTAQKQTLLEDTLPDLIYRYNQLQNDIKNISHELQTTSAVMNSSDKYLRNTRLRLGSFSNLNISTGSWGKTLILAEGNLIDSNSLLNEIEEAIGDLNIIDINITAISQNASIDFNDTKTLLHNVAHNLTILENYASLLQNDNNDIRNNVSDVNNQMQNLNKNMDYLNDMGAKMNSLRDNTNSVMNVGFQANEDIRNASETLIRLNMSINSLKQSYGKYAYDNSTLDTYLNTTKTHLNNLKERYNNASNIIQESSQEQDTMSELSTLPINSTDVLSTVLTTLSKGYDQAFKKVHLVNESLLEIVRDIPLIDANIEKINDAVSDMNDTLSNENDKSLYVKNTLPTLEEKFRMTNVTIGLTNDTLSVMQKRIKQLQDFINKEKLKMQKYDSINISLTDMESNITHMEDRLHIMKSHYSTIEDVVKSLYDEIKSYDILGKNTSLKDVKKQYKAFNNTLHRVDDVLRKIDSEFVEMDDQFVYINDSLNDIDAALDDFEETEINVNAMEMQVNDIGSNITNTSNFIIKMSDTMNRLNETFYDIKGRYHSVLDSTPDANRIVIEQIKNVSRTVENLNNVVKDLLGTHTLAADSFITMNNTLFQNVSTYSGLNATLARVKDSYITLSEDLDNLKDLAVKTAIDTSNVGNSIKGVQLKLKNLNNTLHLEQEKHDYINSNVGNLKSKFNHINAPLDKTKMSIANASNSIGRVDNIVNDLIDKISQTKNINISLLHNSNDLKSLKTKMQQIKDKFLKTKLKYAALDAELAKVEDRTGDISDIQRKYDTLNQTLDSLVDELNEMDNSLKNMSEKAQSIETESLNLNSLLDSYNNVTKTSVGLGNKITIMGENLNTTTEAIESSKELTNSLENDVINMQTMYNDLDSQVLKRNLSDILEELRRQKDNLEMLEVNRKNLSGKYRNTKQIYTEVNETLKNVISHESELGNVINVTDRNVKDTTGDVSKLQVNLKSTKNDIAIAEENIRQLESRLQSVNDSLYEEKLKHDFIAQNYPDIETRYNILANEIGSTHQHIQNRSNHVNALERNLNKIKGRLDQFNSMQFGLTKENNAVSKLQEELGNMTNLFSNTSNMYLLLNLTDLQNRNTSFKQLRKNFTNFDSILQHVKDRVNYMQTRMTDIDTLVMMINGSSNDLNDTINDYVNIKDMIKNISSQSDSATNVHKKVNQTVKQIDNELQQLNATFRKLIENNPNISDEIITATKQTIQNMISSSAGQIQGLKNATDTLGAAQSDIYDNVNFMNETVHKTKSLLSELKNHIVNAGKSKNNATQLLKGFSNKHEQLNKSISATTPKLSQLLDKIKNLSKTFNLEKEKLTYIDRHEPDLKKQYDNLTLPLTNTNKNISLTEVNLADLRFDIKKTGDRLDKFRTINITTSPEMQKWVNMSQHVNHLSASFISLSREYASMKSRIADLDSRSGRIISIKKKYESVNKAIGGIRQGLVQINEELNSVDNTIDVIKASLAAHEKSMDTFKNIQQNAATIKTTLEISVRSIGKEIKDISRLRNFVSKIGETANGMEISYKVLRSKWLSDTIRDVRQNVTLYNTQLNTADANAKGRQDALNATYRQFNATARSMSSNSLTRTTIKRGLKVFETDLGKQKVELNKFITLHQREIKETRRLASYARNTLQRLIMLNATLNRELQKFLYVKEALPNLRTKHIEVNTTFINNAPKTKQMQSQITNLYTLLTKIKDKMSAFGLNNNDVIITTWEKSIRNLNESLGNITTQNNNTTKTLRELKTLLWSKRPMYTTRESLNDVKTRFNGFNRTLDKIKAATLTIDVSLRDLDNASTEVVQQLIERDSILTTTPATTTPSGPPEWMAFTGSTVGVLGRDSVELTCSVDDLVSWKMMKISRVGKDGTTTYIAAWKLGIGARKVIRDRRVSVKKTERVDLGQLKVLIGSMQCRDEGTYYCSVDTHDMWPLEATVGVIDPPKDSLRPEFPTEVFEDKVANFSCTGYPGYPNGKIHWKVKRESETHFRNFTFYSAKSRVSDVDCRRTEVNTVEYTFDMSWNNTKIRCYIDNTDYFGEGVIRLLPYDICNKVRDLGAITHPYTPHKYIICGKELNIMHCPGETCYDQREGNCVQCKEGVGSGDPCRGQTMYSYVAHEYDCRKYYLCMGPTKTTKKCPKGYFAPNIPGNCVLNYNQSQCAHNKVQP